MPPNTLVIDGKTIEPGSTYLQVGDSLGCHRNKRLGFQLETTGTWQGRVEWNGSTQRYLGPRSRRTLRFNEAIPVPYEYPGHQGSDWFDGGLYGMDLDGIYSRAHDWDRMHARCPVFGLIDIETGKPRPLSSIEMPVGGIYSLERKGPDAVLPEFGDPVEMTPNGQHDLRRSRWAAPADEFGRRDQQSVARDLALAWDRKRAARILKAPGGRGSYEIGREAAFVLIAAVDAGDATLRERMCSIMDHVQSKYGHIQIASGGNPAPPDNEHWYSDAEADYLTVALAKAGMKRHAAKQASVGVGLGRKGKYLEISTGRGVDAPTDGTKWSAMGCGIYGRDEVRALAAKFKVGPDHNGALLGPYPNPKAALKAWDPEGGKTRSVVAYL